MCIRDRARSYGAAVYGIDVAISFTACNVSNHRAALVVHVCTSFDCSTITISDSIFSYNQVHYGAVLSGTDIVLNIQRSSLHNNKNMNYRYGGIIHASSESHTCKMSMAIYESNFERNAAYDGGAAVYSTSTNVTIVDSNFLRHYVEQYYYTPNRAALYLTGSIITIMHCIFSNNIAFHGGSALYISTNRATIQNSTFHNNVAISGLSGAIYIHVSDLNITQCIFTDNLAIESGGAMYINANTNDTINIRNSHFSNNMAFENGGAIYIHGNGYNFTCSIDNSNFGYNAAARHGGVIYTTMATVTVNESTFTCNTANLKGNLAYAMDSTNITMANSIWNDDVGVAHKTIYADVTSNVTTRDVGVSISSCDPCQISVYSTTANPVVLTTEKLTPAIPNNYFITTQITSGTTDPVVQAQTTMALNVTHSDTSAISTTNIVVILVVIPCFLALLIASICLLYTSPSPRDATLSRMPSSA